MRTDSRPRTRSRSVVRARKRARGELQSQAEEDWAPQTQEALRATALADALQRSVNNPNQLAWPDCAAWRSKSMFDVYYKVSQVVERDEWDAFSDSLRRPLPTTFRFTTEASAAFKSEGERILSGWASRGTRRLGVVDGWQLHLDKHELRAVHPRTQEATLREWLIRGTDAGHVVRQEVASMLPASLLDVLPDSVCLDMCASPGSKTTQLVERLGPSGIVVANDASPLRCYTLVKRTATLGTKNTAVVVTCHCAQKMPALPALSRRLTESDECASGGAGSAGIFCAQ